MAKKSTAFAIVASALLVLAAEGDARAQSGRDFVYVVGSSTVYPFATIVAERFGRATRFRTPKVESTGSGGGIKLFCDGVGVAFPDVVNASRRITAAELRQCRANGVSSVVEVKVGYGGIVLGSASGAPNLNVTRRQLYLALAKRVPTSAAGETIENPHRVWSDIDAALPNLPILVLGPPPTSGTRDAFVNLVFETGCRLTPWIAELENSDQARFRALCHPVREDGAYVEAGENDNLVVQRLIANPRAFGVLGFGSLDQNAARIKAAIIDGGRPTFESILSAEYPLSRPLFFYVKKAHVPVIPGLREFLREFSSERAWGDDGYLTYRGLVPQSRSERDEAERVVNALEPLVLAER